MINKINSISFEGRFHLNGYSKHTPKAQPFGEFYFMPQLQKQNPIKSFIKKILNSIKGISDTAKNEEKQVPVDHHWRRV